MARRATLPMDFPPFEHARLLTAAWADGPPRHDLGASGFKAPPWPDRGLPELPGADPGTIDLHPETALRDAIAARHGVAAPEVLVTAGTTGANTAAILGLLREEDHVVCERPYYQPLPGLAHALPCEVTYVDRDPDGRLDPDGVAAACSPRTRLILLTSPNNPTGAAVTEEDLRALGDVAQEQDALILCDQVFGELTDHPVAATVHPRCITTSGLNKRWGAPGLRVGWLIAQEDVVAQVQEAHQYAFLGGNPAGQAAAVALLAHAKRCRDEVDARLRETHRVYRKWVDRHGFPPALPGSLTAFPPLAIDLENAHRLRREHGIVALPGACFGVPGHIRVGLGIPPDDLAAALAALDGALASA